MMKNVLISGSTGMLGFHMRAKLTAANAHAHFTGEPIPYKIFTSGRQDFNDSDRLAEKLIGIDVVVHLAAVNRPKENEQHSDNAAMASTLVEALTKANVIPQLIYTNSTQALSASNSNEYGQAKKSASASFNKWAAASNSVYLDLVLPHVFGEAGRPRHNTVTSTLCSNIVNDVSSTISEGARVELVYVNDVADEILKAVNNNQGGKSVLEGRSILVSELYSRLQSLHEGYSHCRVPDLSDKFELNLFNTLRWHCFPSRFPIHPNINEDARGTLFEAVKGGGGGQSFLSWTEPGVTRGDHFHFRKVERFIVLQGEAVIRIRKLFDNTVHTFRVSGDTPAFVDMPTMHTHSIENVGTEKLLTMFWSHELFDPYDPDTYSQKVIQEVG